MMPGFSLRDLFGTTLKAAKWIPAVVCGLLVVAWVVSVFVPIGVAWKDGTTENFAGVRLSNIEFSRTIPITSYLGPRPLSEPTILERVIRRTLGNWVWFWTDYDLFGHCVPVLIPISALLPAAVAPFTRFRFRLWSYFAWMALIAAELAYYLRA
jgi:hypothetical protein